MKKVTVIFFMLLYSLGVLLCPAGDLSCTKSLAAEYENCRAEDPDIDIPDFIFEHLLNLEVVMAHFEHDSEEQKDKPHAPFQSLESSAPMAILLARPLHFTPDRSYTFFEERATYPMYNHAHIPSAYLSDVFHPPSFC